MHNLLLIAAGMMLRGLLTASVTLNYADIVEGVSCESLTILFQQAEDQIEGPVIKVYDQLLMGKISPHLAGQDKTGVDRYLPDNKWKPPSLKPLMIGSSAKAGKINDPHPKAAQAAAILESVSEVDVGES